MPSLFVHAKGVPNQDILVDILPPAKAALPAPAEGEEAAASNNEATSEQELFTLRFREHFL